MISIEIHKQEYQISIVVIWFLSFKRLEELVLSLCKENRSTNSTIIICQ